MIKSADRKLCTLAHKLEATMKGSVHLGRMRDGLCDAQDRALDFAQTAVVNEAMRITTGKEREEDLE